jgi:hypothetical protein
LHFVDEVSLKNLVEVQELAFDYLDVECLTNSYQPYMFEETKELFKAEASNNLSEQEYEDENQEILSYQKEFYENLFLDLLEKAITYLQNN